MNNDYTSYTCYGCHEHSRSNIKEEHVEEGIYEYENCVECHLSGDEDEAEYLWKKKCFNSTNSRQPSLKGVTTTIKEVTDLFETIVEKKFYGKSVNAPTVGIGHLIRLIQMAFTKYQSKKWWML